MTNFKSLALLMFSLLALSACSPHVNLVFPPSREPNPHEEFYTAVAADFRVPGLCVKIADRAIAEYLPNLGTNQTIVDYQKSLCYFNAAIDAGFAQYCDPIRTVTVIPRNDSAISKSICLQIIARNDPAFHLNASLPDRVDIIFEEMGYTDADAQALAYTDDHAASLAIAEGPPNFGHDAPSSRPPVVSNDWLRLYQHIQFQARPGEKTDFLNRVAALPNYSR